MLDAVESLHTRGLVRVSLYSDLLLADKLPEHLLL